LQACRPELLPAAVQTFVGHQLGPAFAEPPAAKLAPVFSDSSAATPIILVVAQGADAMAELAAFAVEQGRAAGRGLQLLSLGQGQGPVAEALVHLAMRNGDWVCLQVGFWRVGLNWVVQAVRAAGGEAVHVCADATQLAVCRHNASP
jgi:dynein heavy chain